MRKQDLLTFAVKHNLPASNRFINDCVDLRDLRDSISFEGSFMEIYNAIKDGKVKLLVEDDNVVGIEYNYSSGNPTLDTLAGNIFEGVYKYLPTMEYVMTAMSLISANLSIDKVSNIKGRTYLYILQLGEIIDTLGNVVVKKTYGEDVTYREEMESALDKALDEQLSNDSCSECVIPSPDSDLPSSVDIDRSDLFLVSENHIKRYLRNTYKHYLSGSVDTPFTYTLIDENGEVVSDAYNAVKVKVDNIHWGRKI